MTAYQYLSINKIVPRTIVILGFLMSFSLILSAAELKSGHFQHIDPPSWWVGMPDENLQILIHRTNIGSNSFEIKTREEGVELNKVEKLPNNNYILLHIRISSTAKPQAFTIQSKGKAGKLSYSYNLDARTPHRRGIDQSDIIYLITPDRFANGDRLNDSFSDMNQIGINRDEPYDRHGGDIQGIIDNLDYIQDLGMTAIWPSPLLENNQPIESYHGYAITNHYQIDKRFGTNELYGALSDSLHSRGMKLIQDVIYNHIGDKHYLYQDIPDSSWFHFEY